jgi:transposase
MTQIIRVGPDLAKNVFELHGVDAQEAATLRGNKVRALFAKLAGRHGGVRDDALLGA